MILSAKWKARAGHWLDECLAEWGRQRFQRHVEEGHVTMGAHSYGAPKIHWDKRSAAKVIIGRYCSIAYGVNILTGGNHNTPWVSTYPHRVMFDLPGKYADGHPSSKGDVQIGNDVWIAQGATIVSGVRIGDGAVVSCGAVVTRDVDPYTLVGGNPARPLRKRFSDEQIVALLAIRWWDWPDERVKAAVPLLCSGDVEAFLREFGGAGSLDGGSR